jgi:hypothetical protein
MVNSPISIPLALSQSRKPSDLAKTQAIAADALKIEHYINSRMDKEYIREFDFAALAADLSMDLDRVGALLSKLAGPEDAITVCNPQKRPRTPAPGRSTSRRSSRSDAGASAWNEPSAIASEATF